MRFPFKLLPWLALLLLPACVKPQEPKPQQAESISHQSSDKAYRSEEGKFTVRFPKEPTISNKELATPAGILKIQTAKSEAGRDLVLSVSHTTYPPSFGEVDPAKILDGVRDGLKGQDGELKSDKSSFAGEDKFPTRDIRIDAGKNGIRARLVLVDRRLVQVLAVGTKEALERKDVDEFFKSFEAGK